MLTNGVWRVGDGLRLLAARFCRFSDLLKSLVFSFQ